MNKNQKIKARGYANTLWLQK